MNRTEELSPPKILLLKKIWAKPRANRLQYQNNQLCLLTQFSATVLIFRLNIFWEAFNIFFNLNVSMATKNSITKPRFTIARISKFYPKIMGHFFLQLSKNLIQIHKTFTQAIVLPIVTTKSLLLAYQINFFFKWSKAS